ncbi:hypothetical protein LRS06_16475 [Hymenobacter sp. J193]|uniref:hypothetical protein n=1 Tax=Hymenobacter sp. J193 TaxID=2898429 RepID=UPI0021512481|nr:hypothetical protein [Hymenobacter sp. J193]MCR5889332.1 hypothetical protein [Hymenobacter sp. J193]
MSPAVVSAAVAAPRQPWIRSARFDGLWILGPPFLALLLVALLPPAFRTTGRMPTLAWLVLVVFIDVAHVYSTLFRTYLDPVRRHRYRTLLWVVPLACYLAGAALYWHSAGWFWRALAYGAVFHFIRQQYGFLRLYSRQETAPGWHRQLDVVLIYAATLYPLLYWHLSAPRNFVWFVTGDFLHYDWPMGRLVLSCLFGLLLVAYLGKEIHAWQRGQPYNVPRNLLLLGTAASWYVGIVLLNGDLAFTLLNVVAHGIPYLALIWVTSQPAGTGRKRAQHWWQGRTGVALFLGLLLGLAYVEEGIWDGLVWREHAPVFGWFQQLPAVSDSLYLALLVPLLALPQATHYVLDGFIWRRNS